MNKKFRVRYSYTRVEEDYVEVEAKDKKQAEEKALTELEENCDFGFDGDFEIGWVEELEMYTFTVEVDYMEGEEKKKKKFQYKEYHNPNDEELKSIASSFCGTTIKNILNIEITKNER